MTQDELLDTLEDEREKFLDILEGLSDETLQEPGVVGDWSVKDIIFHISMWEAEMVQLLWQASQDQRPTTAHLSEVSVDDQNAAWQQLGLTRPLEQVMEDFRAVRKQTSKRLRAFSDEDLNNPQRYPWLDGRSLWEWIVGDSTDHEAEHAAQISEWRKRCGI